MESLSPNDDKLTTTMSLICARCDLYLENRPLTPMYCSTVTKYVHNFLKNVWSILKIFYSTVILFLIWNLKLVNLSDIWHHYINYHYAHNTFNIDFLKHCVLKPVAPGGSLIYSEVRTFLTKDHAVTSKYTSITSMGINTISLTGNHLLYARKSCTEKFSMV